MKVATKKEPKALPPELSTWDVRAHKGILHINSMYCPNRAEVWTIDVENNRDGSCAGIGITADGENIYHYEQIEDKNFFVGMQLSGATVKYDIQMLRKWGFNVTADQVVWDISLAEYVRDSTTNSYGLKDLNKKKFGIVYPTYKELCGTGKKAVDIGTLPLEIRANYNGMDVLSTHKHRVEQMANMTPAELAYFTNIELPTLRVLLEMEERGVQIDTRYIRSLDARFADAIGRVSTSIRNIAGTEINLNSHQQIKRLLVDKAGLSLTTTAAEELSKHEDIPLVKDLLRYRQLAKLKGTYTEGLVEKSNGQETYRLHARFNQTVTHTGRLSSSDPNLQNIPTRTDEGDAIREGFVANKGSVLIDADYSQIEPRLMAHFSEDPALLDIFRSGQDLYDAVATYVGCTRAVAKTLWLALAYNAGAYKIAKTAGIEVWRAQEFLDKMRDVFGGFFYWRDKVMKRAEIDGGVTTLFGRFIPLKLEWAHLAPNYKVQGSAGEIYKLGNVATRAFSPALAIHDEIVYEVSDDESTKCTSVATIKTLLEGIVGLAVPLVVEIGTGRNWSESKL